MKYNSSRKMPYTACWIVIWPSVDRTYFSRPNPTASHNAPFTDTAVNSCGSAILVSVVTPVVPPSLRTNSSMANLVNAFPTMRLDGFRKFPHGFAYTCQAITMSAFLAILVLVLGSAGTLCAFGGKTWIEGTEPVLKRITRRGWLSLVLLALGLIAGGIKELYTQYKDDGKDQKPLSAIPGIRLYPPTVS